MTFTLKKTTPEDLDFKNLMDELNAALVQITQDTGESSFSPTAFDALSDGCIVIYSNDSPVACGVFRYHSQGVCELKRMYSKHPGAGSFLLKKLEAYAIVKGYAKAVLSTRRVNQKAIRFYKRHAYVETSAYGSYVGVERSVCFCKTLFVV